MGCPYISNGSSSYLPFHGNSLFYTSLSSNSLIWNRSHSITLHHHRSQIAQTRSTWQQVRSGSKEVFNYSSPSTPWWNHAVFLSFTGEDSGRNFIDQLHKALVVAGIQTIRDDEEFHRRDDRNSELLKAIEESRVSIVIFSTNYASSKSRLDELVKMEWRRKIGQTVLPVFYDVDPSDVRYQSGSLAEAFRKHEVCFREKVVKWRNALNQAVTLSGWHIKDVADG